VHELTHKIRTAMPQKNYEELFYKTMESKNNFLELKNIPQSLELFKYSVLYRTEMGVHYQNIEKVLEENIADYSKILISNKENFSMLKGDQKNSFEKVIGPLSVFWEYFQKPQILKEIYLHPQRKRLSLPEQIKIEVRNILKHNYTMYAKTKNTPSITSRNQENRIEGGYQKQGFLYIN
jgi:hypothetical protein